ncbi:hypothetical protein [Massilia sp. YIM B02443]|uniref:hypothetical protein n=1 Tax=Massilia sp. YIM B02443 TaxID=3050127 RepID=UPI0025B6BEBA|nr:hypothetical protein [Massilia sp. YIM B02443]MDN4040044.1 hypothetical protein [Massilia sp. YIM B02443]
MTVKQERHRQLGLVGHGSASPVARVFDDGFDRRAGRIVKVDGDKLIQAFRACVRAAQQVWQKALCDRVDPGFLGFRKVPQCRRCGSHARSNIYKYGVFLFDGVLFSGNQSAVIFVAAEYSYTHSLAIDDEDPNFRSK